MDDYITILQKVVLGIILSGVIGLERQQKHRPAGFRTHILVCLGALGTMILSQYSFVYYYENYGIATDPMRLSAQVISGIGFLGAGTIIRAGFNVRGLTTAASLWTVACLGLIVGAGYYALALIITGIMLLTLFTFNSLPRHFEQRKSVYEMILVVQNKKTVIGAVMTLFHTTGAKVMHLGFLELDQPEDEEESDLLEMELVLQMGKYQDFQDLILLLKETKGVVKIDSM